MPPGSAKSTYLSKLFPPWFLRKPNRTILACSYKKELIESFGGVSRDLVTRFKLELGFSLKKDSRAAGEWETTNNGRYFCAGTNAGIAGYRADLAFIDDPIGADEDAKSESFRNKLWAWFWNDFMPRLSPNASVFILANRRHEDDLVGRLLAAYPDEWDLVKIPLVIDTEEQKAADPLGREIGGRLWPEYFTHQKVVDARKSDDFSGLHQQDPSPAEGDLIKKEWLVEYHSVDELPKNLRVYVGSDHALTTREENDANCLIPVGLDSNGNIWVLPDVWWKRSDTGELVEEILNLAQRRAPIVNWWAESEHIEKAIRPFLYERMRQRKLFFPITPLASVKDLQSRSSSIRGMMRMCAVRFPAFASWWPAAKHEMLSFPLGKHDDFIAALSEIGRGLGMMTKPVPDSGPEEDDIQKLNVAWKPSVEWLKELQRKEQLRNVVRYGDR